MIASGSWKRYAWLCLLAMLVGIPLGAAASEGMSRIFRPIRPGLARSSSLWGGASEAAESDSGELALHRYGLRLSESRASDARTEWFYSFSYSGMNIDGDLLLPESGVLVDDLLQDVELGTGFRRARADDIYGWFASLGSASDKPFDSFDETSVMLNAFYKFTLTRSTAWMLMLNYSNRRSFLTNIPLPGAAYVYAPDRRTLIIAGMPFFMIKYPLGESTDISASYFVPDQIKVESNTKIGRGLGLLAGVERGEDSYFLADRASRDHSLYYEESRFYSGVGWRSREGTSIKLTAGYALDRHFYQGEDSDESDRDRVGVEDGFDMGITCLWVF